MDSLLFPLECAACGLDDQDTPFCDDCRGDLFHAEARTCPRCALPVGPWAQREKRCSRCRKRKLAFDAAIALHSYEGVLRSLCLRMKRPTNAWLAHWLVRELVETRWPQFEQLGLSRGSAPESHGRFLVSPIPLHWRRRLERGYNQAESLASELATQLKVKYASPLKRVVPTVPLADKGRTERFQIMNHVFSPRRGAGSIVNGRTVLLVDDVLTTGATCSAAARQLKSAGAARVVVVVVCRA